MQVDLNVINVAIAGASLVIGWFTGRGAERRQYRLGASSFAADWFSELRAWASEAVDVLTEAAHAAPGDGDAEPGDVMGLKACCPRISALIDRGRFYLPNSDPDTVGKHRPEAYRGFRHPALDHLVDAYQVAAFGEVEPQFTSARAALVEARRHFVSHIQSILDPRSQNHAVAELIRLTRGTPASKDAPPKLRSKT